jgi:hypothetical protein
VDPDLSHGEALYYQGEQEFNARSRNLKVVYVNQFGWQMQNVPGVLSVASAPLLAKQAFSGFNEGNPKWAALPQDPKALANAISMAPEGTGLWNPGCTVLPVHLYLADHKATTIKAVVGAVKAFREAHPSDRVKIRLASGNVGVGTTAPGRKFDLGGASAGARITNSALTGPHFELKSSSTDTAKELMVCPVTAAARSMRRLSAGCSTTSRPWCRRRAVAPGSPTR